MSFIIINFIIEIVLIYSNIYLSLVILMLRMLIKQFLQNNLLYKTMIIKVLKTHKKFY